MAFFKQVTGADILRMLTINVFHQRCIQLHQGSEELQEFAFAAPMVYAWRHLKAALGFYFMPVS